MEVLDGNSKTKKTKVLGVGNAGKCTKQRAKKAYSKKKKYHPPKNKEPAASTTCGYHKKVVDVDMASKTLYRVCVRTDIGDII